ncbi:MAG: UDP-N-acetylglucosamine pyrophosphorylase [Lachnospiraceae bacterium]|nr:UDP-N-acetylglucosamine pyrophosphorylase [Lachnospiraceae bacterium]
MENENTIKINEMYDLSATIAAGLFEGKTYPWEVLGEIKTYIKKLGPTLDPDIFEYRGDDIWIARSVTIADTATIKGPVIIDEHTEVRPGAFIRGSAIIGKHCVIGNSTEIKNDIIFDHVQVPHYNYVGDSVLGTYSHMGAGSITSNVKADKTLVAVIGDGIKIETGLKKFGAMLADHVEIGCNTVMNPGTVIGRNTNVYPLSMVRGIVPANSIYKNKSEFEIVPKR